MENNISKEPVHWLNKLLVSVPFGIVILDREGKIKLMNNKARELLDLRTPAEGLVEKSLTTLVENNPALSEQLALFLKKAGKPVYLEAIALKDKYLDCSLHPVEEGSFLIIHDVTREKELENSALQSIISGQENERRRLAREIHDGIAPLLSSAKLELDLFLEELKQCDERIPEKRLLDIRQNIDAISEDLRDLSHRLIPRLLEDFGLYSAFNNLVARINSNIKSRVELYSNLKPEERFEKDVELNLFRCGQELLNNAVKHAMAGTIMLQVIRHEHSIVLMVEDDGSGFDPRGLKTDKEGIGLMNVETRVKMLNGEFILESVKEQGTLVSIEIPI